MAKRRNNTKKEPLKSVVVTLRDSAVESIEEIKELNDCINCDVTIEDFTPNIGASGKKITIFPASIRPKGGKYRLKHRAVNKPLIILEGKQMLLPPKQIPVTL